eukprot:UN23185
MLIEHQNGKQEMFDSESLTIVKETKIDVHVIYKKSMYDFMVEPDDKCSILIQDIAEMFGISDPKRVRLTC